MVEPMKPQKTVRTVNLGGVNFNSNDAKNYGVRYGKDCKLKYFIDLKNGGTVEYSEQPKDPLFKFYEEPKDATMALDSNGRYKFENLQDADIDFSKAQEGAGVGVSYSKNVRITGSETDDRISTFRSENCEINSGEGNDCLIISYTKHAKINTGDGDDFIATQSSENVNINGDAGADKVEIFNDRLSGRVHLDNDDKLTVNLFSYKTDVSLTNEGFVSDTHRWYKKAEIQGGGTHNLAETKGFDVHHIVDRVIYDCGEDGEFIEQDNKVVVDEHYKDEE